MSKARILVCIQSCPANPLPSSVGGSVPWPLPPSFNLKSQFMVLQILGRLDCGLVEIENT